MSSRQGSVQDLRLYGEQMSLNARCEEQTKKVDPAHKTRPRSALYSSSSKTNSSEDHRRPFSAGTEPKSPTLHSFLRRSQTDRVDHTKTSDLYRDYSIIPGSTQSALLFDKLVRDPLDRKSQYSNLKKDNVKSQYKNSYAGDEISEDGSVDTCISLGTKIKERAELTKILTERSNCLIEGNSIRLKKAKPSRPLFIDKLIKESFADEKHLEDKRKAAAEASMKLSIYVPNSKDENTSSGVSSSSDIVHNNLHTNNVSSPKRNGSLLNEQKQTYVLEDIPNRVSRSKKSPHINWFPESLSCSKEDFSRKSYLSSLSDMDSKPNPLEGRVSFGSDAFQSTLNRDDIDNDFDSHPLFNTQLSLVEEESSQDSDLSPNQMSLQNGVNIDEDKPCFNEYTKVFKPENDSCSRSNDDGGKQKYEESTHLQNGSDYDEMEKKFKMLEYKYKAEKLVENSDYKYPTIRERSFQSYPWTSLENVVSKENDEERNNVKVRSDFKPHNAKEETPSHFYIEHDTQSFFEKNKEFSNNYTSSPDENDANMAQSSVADDHGKNLTDYQNMSKVNSNSDANFMYSHSNQERNTERIIPTILIDEVCDSFQKNTSKTENTVKENYAFSQTDTKEGVLIDYPKYLEDSDTKSYTSKVIEDYKKEIATINNFHELTLKDLRQKCKDFYLDKNNFQTKPNPDITISHNKGGNEDHIEITNENVAHDYKMNEAKCSKQTNILKYYINEHSSQHLNKSKFQPQDLDTKTLSDDSSFEQMAKDFFDSAGEKINTKTSKPKIKKKLKRKDKTIHTKPKSDTGNDSTDTKYETKNTRYESRRLLKSAPPANKATTSCVKFKAQKITLSKCKNKVNRPLYTDADRDVVSWMASRVDAPFEETTSCDDTGAPTTDLNIEVPIKVTYSQPNNIIEGDKVETETFKSSSHNNSEHFILSKDFKETLIGGNDTGLAEMQKSEGAEKKESKTGVKNKEVSFDLTSYAPSVDEDGSFNDWDCDDDGNDLNGLMETDTMVTDIYSVLKNIESHKDVLEDVHNESIKSSMHGVSVATTTEYKDIVDFLEKVENSANEEMSSLSYTQPQFALKVEELMELSKGELAHRAVTGALAAHKASATAAKLRAALAGAARRAAARVQQAHKQARQRSAAAAQSASQAIARHQKFIEQLIGEKRSLTERIEQVVGAAGAAEARRARGEKAAAERLQLELRNQRQRLQTQHHRERQAWLKQHTQKIKEMTVKGLEGELRAMEEATASRVAAAQLAGEQALQREREQHQQDMRRLKDQLVRDMEDQRDRERLAAAERLEQKRLEWESALSGAAERAGAESREAARHAEELGREARREAERWLQQQQQEMARQAEEQERRAKEKRDAMEEELSRLRDNITKDLDIYKEEYNKKQAQIFKTKEMELRATMRRERDKEIEKAVDCLEREAQEGKREMQENIRRLKEKYEEDIKSLEDLEKAALSRCKEAREQLRETQEECAMKLITITQLEGRLKQSEELKLQSAAQTELLVRAATMKGREETEEVRNQLKTLQQQHKDVMHQLYAKVKVAVSRKDDALTAARRDATTLRERCMRLEARLTNT